MNPNVQLVVMLLAFFFIANIFWAAIDRSWCRNVTDEPLSLWVRCFLPFLWPFDRLWDISVAVSQRRKRKKRKARRLAMGQRRLHSRAIAFDNIEIRTPTVQGESIARPPRQLEDGPTIGEIQERAISISRTTTLTRVEADVALMTVLEAGGTLDAAEEAVRTTGVSSMQAAMRSFGVSAEQAAQSMGALAGALSQNELRVSMGFAPLEGTDQIRVVRKAKREPELPPVEERPVRRIILQEDTDD